ncbi:MAG: hypothetical protein QOH39_1544 [Verrucomicrobiota bacterium]|jgi:hypothetical protein
MISQKLSIRAFVALTAVLALAHGAYADGSYQKTKDGKNLVWNNNPGPEDAAKWTGHRDEDGYATGHGTLVWYRVERAMRIGSNLPIPKYTLVSRYSGNMVKGKFGGSVVGIDPRGNVYHSTFADGARRSKWAAGGAPAIEEPRERASHRKEAVVEQAENSERPAPNLESIHEAAVQRPEVEPPAEGPPVIAKQDAPKISKGAKIEGPNLESDSVRSLAMPPSSLRTGAGDNVSTEASKPATSASKATPPQLNKPEVIALADAEAHTQGYDLSEYQGRQVKYAAAEDRWAVVYNQKSEDGAAKPGKHFSVTVEDKTKKTAIVPGE